MFVIVTAGMQRRSDVTLDSVSMRGSDMVLRDTVPDDVFVVVRRMVFR